MLIMKRNIFPLVQTKYLSKPYHFFQFSTTSFLPCSQNSGATIPRCVSLLQSFAKSSDLSKGKELHSWMLKHNLLSSPLSITSLINMYSKCNHISYALSVFEAAGNIRNIYAYNAIISGFVGNGMLEEGYEFYLYMRHFGVSPDKFTFPCAVKCCPTVLDIKNVHNFLFKIGLDADLFIGSALVNCYLKFGAVDEGYKVFGELPVRDVVLWNAMINGYVHIGEYRMALKIFRKMNEEYVTMPNNFTATGIFSALSMSADIENGRAFHAFVMKKGYELDLSSSNALIDMYGKCNCVDSALQIFHFMPAKDIFSWNTLIAIHAQAGDHHGTIELFRKMLNGGLRPDVVTITTLLPSCSQLGAFMHVKEVHRYMIVNELDCTGKVDNGDYASVHNALMDVYVKCGRMIDAESVFRKMSVRDVASWNIMIMGYGMHGHGYKSLSMFDSMCAEGISPDGVTFVGVLSACSHVGLVTQGRDYLSQMNSSYGLVPSIEHYVCVIDLLGRAGQLDDAYDLLRSMPVKSNAVAWRAFLAACKLHGNADLAEVACKYIFELEPEHCGNYVLMANVYGTAGRYKEVSDLRLTMRVQNIRKQPGYSWIEVNNSVHVFVTRDQDHPDCDLIYASLDSLVSLLSEHGYGLAG